jgi:exosortase/archaeosortase family protein
MNSLLALLTLAALWIHVTRGGWGGRLALAASVLPLVLAANTARVALVLHVAAAFGEEAALGFFHGASSLVLFGLSLGGLLLVGRAAGCKLDVADGAAVVAPIASAGERA